MQLFWCVSIVPRNVKVLLEKPLSSVLSNDGYNKPSGFTIITGHKVRDYPLEKGNILTEQMWANHITNWISLGNWKANCFLFILMRRPNPGITSVNLKNTWVC